MGCLLFKNKLIQDVEQVSSNTKVKRKIVMIGLDGAGKTTILKQIQLKKYMDTVPTIGLNVETVKYKNLEFLVFDVGGKVRSLWTHYYENLDAIIFVIDSTDRERVWQIKDELIKLNNDLKFQQVVILAFFNKIDLKNCIDYKTLIEETGVHDVIEHDVIVQKCSAKTGEGLYEGLDKLTNYFVNIEKQPSYIKENGQKKEH